MLTKPSSRLIPGTSWLALAVALLAAPLAGQQLWIVDASGGAGSQFNAIQPAVDIAQPGDTVYIRPGSYSGFSIDGKGISVVGINLAVVKVGGPIAVRNVPAGGTALLAGLDVEPPDFMPGASGFAITALHSETNAGTVWVQDCALGGADALAGSSNGGSAAILDSSADVFLMRCALIGGRGGPNGTTSIAAAGGSGGVGLETSGSHVTVVESTCDGGDGAQQSSAGFVFANGGDALRNVQGSVNAWGSGFRGGDGGQLLLPMFGASGGNGVAVYGSGAIARLSVCAATGGAAGQPSGLPGQPFLVGPGAAIHLLYPNHQPAQLYLPSHAAVGESVTLFLSSVGGLAPALNFAILSPVAQYDFDGALASVLLDPSAGVIASLGLAGGGQLDSITWTVPALPSGIEATTLYMQLGSIWLQQGELAALSSPRSLTLTAAQ